MSFFAAEFFFVLFIKHGGGVFFMHDDDACRLNGVTVRNRQSVYLCGKNTNKVARYVCRHWFVLLCNIIIA